MLSVEARTKFLIRKLQKEYQVATDKILAKLKKDTEVLSKDFLSHEHSATDITAGTMSTARLGSGVADSTTFLRGDQTWQTAGGGTAADVDFTPAGGIAATDVQAAIEELDTEKAAASHNHAAADITSGTIATARLGSGTANNTTFLRGDQTWVTPAGTGDMTKAVYDTTDNGFVDAAEGLVFDAGGGGESVYPLVANGDGEFLFITGGEIRTGFPDKSQIGLGNVDDLQQQPIDADLTAIAGLAPTNDDIIQRKAGAWTNRTPAQYKTDLALVKGDVGLGNVDNVQQQPIDSDLTAIAAINSALSNVIASDGAGWIAKTYSQFKTALSLSKADVGLGNVTNDAQLKIASDLSDINDAGLARNNLGLGSLAVEDEISTAFLQDDAVTYAKMQNVSATSRFLGRITGGAGNTEELTGTQATTLLDAFTSGLKGLAPASGGGTTNFLRADGTWAAPTAADPAGWTTIVKSANQDVTNAGVTADTEFTFNVTANNTYRIIGDFTFGGNNATGDHIFDFVVGAGTMKGHGTVQNLTAALAVQNILITASGAANTTAIVTGTPADLDLPIAVKVNYAFRCTNTTTFTFRFGNSSAAGGRTSRNWKGSVLRWKNIT